MMIARLMLLIILFPLFAAAISFVLPVKQRGLFAFLTAAVDLFIAAVLFRKEASFTLPWLGRGIDFALRLYHFNGFILLSAAFFALLISLYSLKFLEGKKSEGQFYAYFLISLSFINGAVLANHLLVLLFFWEGLLLTLYGLIIIGGKQSFRTAAKAFIIVGIGDLCMMAGIILTGYLAKTLIIQNIHLTTGGIASLAFILLVVGAIAKAGCMPFHTWIPDAAQDSPLPFMAFFPAALEKLLGIYFLTRITLDMFNLSGNGALSVALMSIGAITIIAAVMMALIQKDYKRLLSYHAISQVGYMILGIGTCLPAGIIGGIFHMLNNAVYKCGLFLTAGTVEQQTGTTDLNQLGGLRKSMPVTFFCFLITAASISGVPPFNGFFSKELIYDAALERGKIFYLAAIVGSFFTAASFLKLGHAAFLDKPRQEHKGIKEAPFSMLLPLIILASTCVFFGIFNRIPINNLIQPVLRQAEGNHNFSGWPTSPMLVFVTVVVLLAALLHHAIAAKAKGSGLKAADHIHHAPVLSVIYAWAEKKYFDPYEVGMKIIGWVANLLSRIDKGVDWVYEFFTVKLACECSAVIRKVHAGYYIIYISWALAGTLAVLLLVLR